MATNERSNRTNERQVPRIERDKERIERRSRGLVADKATNE